MQEDTYQGSQTQPLTQNRYSYVLNNPINLWDPTGYAAEEGTGGGVGGGSDVPDWVGQPEHHELSFEDPNYSITEDWYLIEDRYKIESTEWELIKRETIDKVIYSTYEKEVTERFPYRYIYAKTEHVTTPDGDDYQRNAGYKDEEVSYSITSVYEWMGELPLRLFRVYDFENPPENLDSLTPKYTIKKKLGSTLILQEDEKDKKSGINWGKTLDTIQLGLDIAGLVPGFGEAFDGINAVIYLARGDKANAALSAAAMRPVIGMAATGGKILGRTVKYSDEVIDAGKSIKVKKGGQGINQPIDEFDDSQIYFDAAKGRGKANSQWYNPDSSINYPPNNGAVPGTEVNTTLEKGQTLGRFGNVSSTSDYVTAPGASPGSLSLPPSTNSSIYTEYVVVKPIPKTVQSEVAPWGGDLGGGLQYKLPMPIEQLLKEGFIIKK